MKYVKNNKSIRPDMKDQNTVTIFIIIILIIDTKIPSHQPFFLFHL